MDAINKEFSAAFEKTMDVLLGEKYFCSRCGKQISKQDFIDFGMCAACDHIEIDNPTYET